jgi:hypothetical protein
MGTRHFVGVIHKGEWKIAQYGQWDGYPSGQGKTVLAFLRRVKWDVFKKQLTKVSWITDAELEEIDIEYGNTWHDVFPELSRDTGAEILNIVYESDESVIRLKDAREAIPQDWDCEFAYVIDLDNKKLEVYNCHNDKESRAKNRFKEAGGQYINLTKVYPLSKIPTLKQLCKDVEPPEDEDY